MAESPVSEVMNSCQENCKFGWL